MPWNSVAGVLWISVLSLGDNVNIRSREVGQYQYIPLGQDNTPPLGCEASASLSDGLIYSWFHKITCGDDCLAIKGVPKLLSPLLLRRVCLTTIQNSTNIVAKDITCRGGNGIAFGSLGQYVEFVSHIRTCVPTTWT